LSWWFLCAGVVLYVPIGVALCRFWTWVDGPGSRHDYNVCIWLWPLFGTFVLPILWLAERFYDRFGDRAERCWERVLRLAGWDGQR
jgi:hypothetical protein